MSLKERASALGFSSAGAMVRATGYANSTLEKMRVVNPSKFEAVTLSARIGEMTVSELKHICSTMSRISGKRVNTLTAEELRQLFGEVE